MGQSGEAPLGHRESLWSYHPNRGRPAPQQPTTRATRIPEGHLLRRLSASARPHPASRSRGLLLSPDLDMPWRADDVHQASTIAHTPGDPRDTPRH
jgi:hypothetical protein